jgi:hypothetical protein
LLGVAVCGQCGAPSAVTRAAKHYVCRGRMIARKGSEGRCAAPGVRVAAADELAWDAIRGELEDPELDRAIAGEVSARAADHRDWEADAAGYRGKLDRLQVAESALLARFTRGTVGEAALDAELARIARERTVLQAQLEACGRASTAVAASSECLREASAILGQLRERLAGAPFVVRRALVRPLVRPGGAVFDAEDIRITLRVPRPPAAGAHVDGSARGTGRPGC